ncbi:MAG: tRNA (adenosine(37)-N6)-dimethylallyltransferase MiaA [Ornithinibacter sp.]
MSTDAPVIIGVVGATATGKSALGIELAGRVGGEVVGADASQRYRGMDIGTAKVPLEERHGIPHHQIDVLDVTQEASVSDYQQAARADIEAIRGRGSVVVVVGGSGLYVRAALDRLEIPPTDPAVRQALQDRADAGDVAGLRAELARADPEAAAAIEGNNIRRIVRALEVIVITGRPFSATMPRREFVSPTALVGLKVPRPVLYERIAARTSRMFADGLVEETRALERRGLRDGVTARRAVGYAQALAVIDTRMTPEEAVIDTTQRTRRLVRRQESWFGADPRITWFDPSQADLVDRVVELVHRVERAGDPASS